MCTGSGLRENTERPPGKSDAWSAGNCPGHGEGKKAPIAALLFGDAGRDHTEKYGTKVEAFATIAVKKHLHCVNNPRSQYQQACSLEEVLASRMVHDTLILLQACPTGDGGAAAVVVSEAWLKKNPHAGAVEIAGLSIATDMKEDYARGPIGIAGVGMCERAAAAVYEKSGIGSEGIQVLALHGCFGTPELLAYEGLGLCDQGEGEKLVRDGATTYGGRWVVNPSGGSLSKGRPIGATGAVCGTGVAAARTGAEAQGRQCTSGIATPSGFGWSLCCRHV